MLQNVILYTQSFLLALSYTRVEVCSFGRSTVSEWRLCGGATMLSVPTMSVLVGIFRQLRLSSSA